MKCASECFLLVKRFEELAHKATSAQSRDASLKLAKSWRQLGELAKASEAKSSSPAKPPKSARGTLGEEKAKP